jgi:hypothetical protein
MARKASYDKGIAIARLYKVIEHGKMLTLDESSGSTLMTRRTLTGVSCWNSNSETNW